MTLRAAKSPDFAKSMNLVISSHSSRQSRDSDVPGPFTRQARLVLKSANWDRAAVPRHREIKEHLAQHIIRMLSNADD